MKPIRGVRHVQDLLDPLVRTMLALASWAVVELGRWGFRPSQARRFAQDLQRSSKRS